MTAREKSNDNTQDADGQASPASAGSLLPCPFCGGEAAISGSDWNGPQFYVHCLTDDCYCCVGEGYDRDACPDHCFSSESDAAKAWNRRANND